MPNFSTSLFESFMVNTYDHLSDSELPDSPGQPFFTSSPLKPLRGENGKSNYNKPKNTKILVINFQSVKNKTEELCNLIYSSNLSMIISTETWLQKDISSSEIFPDSYTVYRKDGYGGVLIALKSEYVSEEIDIESDTEFIFVKISLLNNKSLITGSIYL